MIQAELFEKIGQSAALAVGRDKTEPADQFHIAHLDHPQPIGRQLVQHSLHRNERERIGIKQVMLDTLGTAQLHLDVQLPQRQAVPGELPFSRITNGKAGKSAAVISSRVKEVFEAEVTSTNSSSMKSS